MDVALDTLWLPGHWITKSNASDCTLAAASFEVATSLIGHAIKSTADGCGNGIPTLSIRCKLPRLLAFKNGDNNYPLIAKSTW
ncbi:unnamed protein product [Dovyalis caffra]|uniref:Uncharacterized protein n=1 Tax=Dovyalis caffra TaxID=77055 RepID=A0AAV1S5P4_9ROSI|nr:unnamed protein product [Dovyalis caffra]